MKAQLIDAARLYGILGDTSQVVIATTILGLAHAAEGDTSGALLQMESAVEVAEQSGTIRSQIFSHFRYGQLLRRSGDYLGAEPIVSHALDAANVHLVQAHDVTRSPHPPASQGPPFIPNPVAWLLFEKV